MNETTQPTPAPKGRSLKFKIGVFFLLVNVPFGYGGGALAAAIAAKSGHPKLGAALGIGIYLLSWGMLGLGIVMAGPEGVALVKQLKQKWFGKKKAPAAAAEPTAEKKP